MSTTTIRLPAELKARLAQIAERKGSSAHALILDAVADRVESEERKADFQDSAEQRFAQMAQSGQAIPWEDMKTWLSARASGEAADIPAPSQLGRDTE